MAISTKNNVHELPDELPNNFRLNILRNKEIFEKPPNWVETLLNLPSRNNTLVITLKNYAKADIKVFCSCPVLLNFLTLSHKFCPQLSVQANFCWLLVSVSCKF